MFVLWFVNLTFNDFSLSLVLNLFILSFLILGLHLVFALLVYRYVGGFIVCLYKGTYFSHLRYTSLVVKVACMYHCYCLYLLP